MKLYTRSFAACSMLAIALLAPLTAQAAECGDYPLTQEERDLIGNLPVAVPEGEVPVIQRCDTNGDGAVNIFDIRQISLNRNQPAAHPDDPMDFDGNGSIDVLDARGCVAVCDLPRCAVGTTAALTVQATTGGVAEDSQCFQRTDLDGDGNEDVAAIFENTAPRTRGGDWTLETSIIFRDETTGALKQVSYPYSGKRSAEGGGQVRQHLSLQPAGEVDLDPGRIVLQQPGVVSYRDGQPAVLYYYRDGKINRAFFGIDD